MTRKRNRIPLPAIKVGDKPLEVVDTYKYLGIWITNNLSWNKHIDGVCKKANRQSKNYVIVMRALSAVRDLQHIHVLNKVGVPYTSAVF